MSDDADNPLAFYPTIELVNEVLGRFQHALFAGIKESAGMAYEPGDYAVIRHWRGNSATVAGLGLDVGRLALKAMDDEGEHHDPNDQDVI